MNQRTNLHLMFLIIIGICLVSGSGFVSPGQFTDYPNQQTILPSLKRSGDIVILPNHGTVYIATDFHTHFRDFNQWLKRTNLIERLEAGEDIYGLILGDIIDKKPGDASFEPLGDTKIINRIMRLQKQLGSKGERLICIKGNHEFAAATTYAMLKKHGMNADNRQRMIDALYQGTQGEYFQQFNFIERMTDEQYDYLMELPTVVIGKNGFVGIHAGPSCSVKSLVELIHPTQEVLDELLWGRPAVVQIGGYTSSQTEAFLKRIGGNLLAVGHTPLIYLPEKNIKNGVALLGKHQIIFTTGYGASPGVPSYLVINLSKRYESVFDLEYGVEIQPLYP